MKRWGLQKDLQLGWLLGHPLVRKLEKLSGRLWGRNLETQLENPLVLLLEKLKVHWLD